MSGLSHMMIKSGIGLAIVAIGGFVPKFLQAQRRALEIIVTNY